MNILYVEDNKINAVVMNKVLSKNSSNVTIAHTPTEALQIVQNKQLDLILLDINLGQNQIDGCELLQKLRELKTIENIPVFAVTAYAMPGDKQRFKNIGFNKYFSKPVNFNRLLIAISKIKIRLAHQ